MTSIACKGTCGDSFPAHSWGAIWVRENGYWCGEDTCVDPKYTNRQGWLFR